MKKPVMATVLALSLAAVGPAFAQESKPAPAPTPKPEVTYASADKLTFTEVIPGASRALVWGDPNGLFGSYTKMAPGFEAGMHTHTHDTWCVVLKGAYLYRDEAGEKRVAPGEFIRIPGGHPHWSGSDPKEGALFYQESAGAFDLLPVKQ